MDEKHRELNAYPEVLRYASSNTEATHSAIWTDMANQLIWPHVTQNIELQWLKVPKD